MTESVLSEMRSRYPGADPRAIESALLWSGGAARERARGIEALAALPPEVVLATAGIPCAAARAADSKRLILAALGADPFRPPARPLSPATVLAVAKDVEVPSWLLAAERTPPQFEVGTGTETHPRPVVLLARGGGLEALGGIFDGPPLVSQGPDDALLAYSPGGAGAVVRFESHGAEVLRWLETGGALSAAWHAKHGLLTIGRDGILRAGGAPLCQVRFSEPCRIIVVEDAIYVHGRGEMQLRRIEEGKARPVMEESASAVAVDAHGRVVALLKGPRRATAGKRSAPTHRIVRAGALGLETVAAADGDGEIAMLGDIVLHVALESGHVTAVDLAGGAIRRMGFLPGAEGVTSLVATRRAVYVTTERSGHVLAYGPSPYVPASLAARSTPGAGDLAEFDLPAGLVAVAGRRALLSNGAVLGITVPPDGRPCFSAATPAMRLDCGIRSASGTLEGGVLVVPANGTPLFEITARGEIRPMAFTSHGVLVAARFGGSMLAIATVDGRLIWTDLDRGVIAEIARPGVHAMAPIGPQDLIAAHDGGLERLMHAGAGLPLEVGTGEARAVAGSADGAVALVAGGVRAFGPDGEEIAARSLAVRRDALVSLVGPRAALVAFRGDTRGWLWRF